MEVEIQVKVNGQVVRTHVQQVQGTLEQMEEAIHSLSKQVACNTLQASVDAVQEARPLFRKRAGGCGTKGISSGR